MHIQDSEGKELAEVTVRLDPQEMTDLLVAASEIEDGTRSHGMLRDRSGTTLAIYKDSGESGPLDRGTDWWVGLVVLIAALFLIVGAFTLARGVVDLIF